MAELSETGAGKGLRGPDITLSYVSFQTIQRTRTAPLQGTVQAVELRYRLLAFTALPAWALVHIVLGDGEHVIGDVFALGGR